MGRRGPKPQKDSEPTARRRNTYYRKLPLPEFDPASIHAPAGIAEDVVAMTFWNDHASTLIEQKRLRPESAATFAILCKLYADEKQLRQIVAEEGWTVNTEKGPVAHPAASQLNRIRGQYATYAKEFGLTAASEARMPHEEERVEEEANPLKAFGITG